ncbi:transcriptional regulator [Salinarimonas sp.]|uniref:helix-turn-helix domain-containing protein n=1 Tax=Salinarimonas sp. TaxID=2766526 RepID=UPI0032D96786
MPAYQYVESGLDNVLIEGATFMVSDDAGESCIDIPNVNGLHHAIAEAIVNKRTSITGKELRFLRTEMAMTQSELAAVVHREPLAISRWERGEVEIDRNAEALIRLYAVEELGLEDAPGVGEVAAWCVPNGSDPTIIIDGSDPDNYRSKPLANAA